MSETPTESVLKWAADAVGVGAKVVAVKRLHEGSGPRRVRVDYEGTIHEVVLRVAGRIWASGIATGAASARR